MKKQSILKLVTVWFSAVMLTACQTYVQSGGGGIQSGSAIAVDAPPPLVVDQAATAAVQNYFSRAIPNYRAQHNGSNPPNLQTLESQGYGTLPKLAPNREYDYDASAGAVRVIHR